MSKAFTKESDRDDGADGAPAIPKGVKNYITPAGFQRLQDELKHLLRVERPKVVEVVSVPASR